MSPQSGLPHNNRVGDFDVFALPVLLRETGKSLEQVLDILANQSGLEGLCGAAATSATSRPPPTAGDARAELALDVFIASIRHYLGAFLLELGGADAIVFTGGIGENSVADPLGRLPRPGLVRHRARPGARTPAARPSGVVSAAGSRVQVWTMPTNEEIVVARQSRDPVAIGSSDPRLIDSNRRGRLAMFLARVTGSVVATQKVASMTGHKLLTVEPYRVDEKGARPAGAHRPDVRRRRHAGRRASTRWS